MRPALKAFALLAGYLALATVLAIRYPQGAFAFKQTSPTTGVIEGQPVCPGPPTATGRLVFANGTWCDDSTYEIWNSFNPTITNGLTGQISRMGNTLPPNVYKLAGFCVTAPAGCTTSPVIAARCNSVVVESITLNNGAVTYDSGVSKQACAVQLDLVVATAAAGCTTAAANCNFSVMY